MLDLGLIEAGGSNRGSSAVAPGGDQGVQAVGIVRPVSIRHVSVRLPVPVRLTGMVTDNRPVTSQRRIVRSEMPVACPARVTVTKVGVSSMAGRICRTRAVAARGYRQSEWLAFDGLAY